MSEAETKMLRIVLKEAISKRRAKKRKIYASLMRHDEVQVQSGERKQLWTQWEALDDESDLLQGLFLKTIK